MTTSGRLAGKRVLVTGSGTGLGAGIAIECAREGAAVAVHYGRSKDGATRVVEQLHNLGAKAQAFSADLAELDQVRDLAKQAVDFLGGLDVLVNNAGITMNVPFAQVTPEQFDRLYGVNVRGAYFLIQAVLDPLKESQGAVVNLTSIHAVQGMPEHSTYAGTKGAIVSYTRALAIELGQLDIRVNAIAPSLVDTPLASRFLATEEKHAAMAKRHPLNKVGQPSDIGQMATFLLGPRSGWVTGQVFAVDGGLSTLQA